MRVHDAYTRFESTTLNRAGRTNQAHAGKTSNDAKTFAAAEEDVRVQVSPEAQALLSRAGAETSSAKVEALRSKIKDGKFQINASAIAARLVGEE